VVAGVAVAAEHAARKILYPRTAQENPRIAATPEAAASPATATIAAAATAAVAVIIVNVLDVDRQAEARQDGDNRTWRKRNCSHRRGLRSDGKIQPRTTSLPKGSIGPFRVSDVRCSTGLDQRLLLERRPEPGVKKKFHKPRTFSPVRI
jgi:hypothetical protein